jgi:hypothetical protein
VKAEFGRGFAELDECGEKVAVFGTVSLYSVCAKSRDSDGCEMDRSPAQNRQRTFGRHRRGRRLHGAAERVDTLHNLAVATKRQGVKLRLSQETYSQPWPTRSIKSMRMKFLPKFFLFVIKTINKDIFAGR